jgi:hypothetical protein
VIAVVYTANNTRLARWRWRQMHVVTRLEVLPAVCSIWPFHVQMFYTNVAPFAGGPSCISDVQTQLCCDFVLIASIDMHADG